MTQATSTGRGAKQGRKRGRHGRDLKIAATVIVALLALVLVLHLVLPQVILKVVNKKLAAIPDTYAHIEDIDISLLRGAYTIDGIVYATVDDGDTLSVFTARHVDFSVEWGALLRGKLVSEIALAEPRLTMRPAAAERTDDTSSFDFADLRRSLEGFFPFTINRFDIRDGALHFVDSARSPPVDIRVDGIDATARGLTNAQEADGDEGGAEENKAGADKEALPASFRLTGRAMGHAPVVINLGLAPLAEAPTFDLDAELKTLKLASLNAFFRAYAGVDVEAGTFSMYTEVAAADGDFKGYIKPLTKDLKILDLEEEEGNLIEVAWEALVAGAGKLLENPPEEQVGTKIVFSGSFKDPQADIWETVIYLLRNAFVQALQPGIENSIKFEGGPTLEEEKSQEKEEAEKS